MNFAVKIDLHPDPLAAARAVAARIASAARDSIRKRGLFTLATSGGRTPWLMLEALAGEDVPWAGFHLFQVDERAAPDGDPDRNWTHIAASFLSRVPLSLSQLHPMPVTEADLSIAAERYGQALAACCGEPPVIDLVHLGLGADGHTASLVPGDPVLEVGDADVAPCGLYQGRRRLTLTFPALNRAREVLWLITGAEKAPMLARLREGDPSIPAGRVRQERARVIADRAAALPAPVRGDS